MKLSKLKLVSLVAIFAAVPFVAGMYVEKASAHEGHDHGAEATQAQANTDKKEDAPAPEAPAAVYSYVAQPGDSYSQIARKAVQTYGIDNKVNLSQAQIIYTETMLTQAAHSPFLNQGQKVSVKQADVKTWVEKAQKLTAAQEAAWQVYTVGVDFNTDRVGEARAA
jgi:hypothetical protein